MDLRRVKPAWFGVAEFLKREPIYATPGFQHQMNEKKKRIDGGKDMTVPRYGRGEILLQIKGRA